MTSISNVILKSNFLHHAYILVGDPVVVVPELINILEGRFGEGFTSSANPDFVYREMETWGIEESRELKNFSSHRPVSGAVKVAVISPINITFQAQNSLLKILEEPSAGTHFFIITRRLEEYLPTVVSRCQTIKSETVIFPVDLEGSVKDWLSADSAKRLEIAKNILKYNENDASYLSGWINCLLTFYWTKVSNKNIEVINSIFKALAYADQRGGSPRIILEHLSMIVPVL